MGKKKSPVKDAIEKSVRNILDEHGELISQELEGFVIKAGFNVNTYEKLRPGFEWIDSRKDAENKTYWFVKKKLAPAPPLDKPRWTFPSINLNTLNREDTARMLRTTDDPLLRHLLNLIEGDEDAYQKGLEDGYEKGQEDGSRDGHEEALNKVEDLVHEVECCSDADSSIKSAFDTLLAKIDLLRAA